MGQSQTKYAKTTDLSAYAKTANIKAPPTSVSTANCVNMSTTANENGNGNMVYLDRHNVTCPSGKVMTQWQLSNPNSKQIQVNYTCCNLSLS